MEPIPKGNGKGCQILENFPWLKLHFQNCYIINKSRLAPIYLQTVSWWIRCWNEQEELLCSFWGHKGAINSSLGTCSNTCTRSFWSGLMRAEVVLFSGGAPRPTPVLHMPLSARSVCVWGLFAQTPPKHRKNIWVKYVESLCWDWKGFLQLLLSWQIIALRFPFFFRTRNRFTWHVSLSQYFLFLLIFLKLCFMEHLICV